MKIIDTHQHLWDLRLFRYAWLDRQPDPQSLAAGKPGLKRSFRPADYLEATCGLELEKSVHVEADVDEAYMLGETRHVLALAERDDNPVAGVVAAARPESNRFRKYVEMIAGHPALKGLRRILHTQPDEIGKSRTFIHNVGSLASYGLSFDICVLARQLPIAINLVRQWPKVSFILDHCGVPQVKEKVLDPWRAHIREISRFPNVVCKVSGLVAYADPEHWTPDDLRPYVDHVIECFGWDRVMFGSDWPVCTQASTLKRWVETLASLTQGATEAERSKLFSENGRRIYRLQ